MSRLRLAVLLGALVPAAAASAQTYEVETLQSTGAPERRIDLVLLGDGYRAQDQTLLHTDAQNVVETLFGQTPFREYRGLFNIRLIHVVSNEQGADNGTYGVTRDTALDATFNCNNIDRLLCVNIEKVRTIAAQNAPEYDLLVVLVNDPKYGGSGGQVAAISQAAQAGEILRHELGHTLAALADEYSTPYPGYPACVTGSRTDCPEPNATVKKDRAEVKWAAWVEGTTPVPTPSTGTDPEIGVFEGCRYEKTGVYRPKDADCEMNSLGRPYCAVCAEAMVRSFWKLSNPVDGYSPAGTAAAVTPCGPVTFTVTPPFASNQWGYLWTMDGVAKAGDTTRFTLANTDLPEGVHDVAALVSDHTPLVRNDPNNALQETQRWQVTVGACVPGPCDESAACDAQAGACVKTYKPQGTACAPQSCTGSTKLAVSACDATGACVAPEPISCGAYACDEAGTDCRTSCKQDTDCATGATCIRGACVLPGQPFANKGLLSCFGCSSGGGSGGVALGLGVLTLLARRRRR